jgi:hypothetical protein
MGQRPRGDAGSYPASAAGRRGDAPAHAARAAAVGARARHRAAAAAGMALRGCVRPRLPRARVLCTRAVLALAITCGLLRPVARWLFDVCRRAAPPPGLVCSTASLVSLSHWAAPHTSAAASTTLAPTAHKHPPPTFPSPTPTPPPRPRISRQPLHLAHVPPPPGLRDPAAPPRLPRHRPARGARGGAAWRGPRRRRQAASRRARARTRACAHCACVCLRARGPGRRQPPGWAAKWVPFPC